MMADFQHVRALGDKSQRFRSAQFIQSDLADSAQFIHGETVISAKSAQFNMPKTAMRMKFPPDGGFWRPKKTEQVAIQADCGESVAIPQIGALDKDTLDALVALLEPPYDLIVRWMQHAPLDRILALTTYNFPISKHKDGMREIRMRGNEGTLVCLIPNALHWDTLKYAVSASPWAFKKFVCEDVPEAQLLRVRGDRACVTTTHDVHRAISAAYEALIARFPASSAFSVPSTKK